MTSHHNAPPTQPTTHPPSQQTQHHQQNTADLFSLLETNDKRTVDEVKNLIHENLNTCREPILVYNLVEYYMQSQSSASVDIIVGIREPHDKALFDKLNDYMKGSTRLHVLTLLGYVVRKQPSWLHKIVQHQLMGVILKCLKSDIDVPVLTSGCLLITTLLPVIPVGFGHHLHDVFAIFTRLAAFTSKKASNVPDVFLVHLRIAVYALFHRLYGMYPCGFVAFLRQFYSKTDNIIVFENVIRPMLERVRVHPLLITGSKDMEVSNKRWKRMEIHDIIIECAKLSLDMIEGTPEANTKPVLPELVYGEYSERTVKAPSNEKFLRQVVQSAPSTPAVTSDHEPRFFSIDSRHWPRSYCEEHQNQQNPYHELHSQFNLPLYQREDKHWTPSFSSGLHTPPPEMSGSDSDYVNITNEGWEHIPSPMVTSANSSVSDLSLKESPVAALQKRNRRQTVPILSSKSLACVDQSTPGSSATTSTTSSEQPKRSPLKRRSLEETGKTDKPDVESHLQPRGSLTTSDLERTSLLGKSDSLGLLTGGYRCDDSSVCHSSSGLPRGASLPENAGPKRYHDDAKHHSHHKIYHPQHHIEHESLPELDSSLKDESEAASVDTSVEIFQDRAPPSDQLNAESATLFMGMVQRSRYTSERASSQEPRDVDDISIGIRARSSSMPMIQSASDDKISESVSQLSPRRISQSSNDLSPTSPEHNALEPTNQQPPTDFWKQILNRPLLPYEELLPSALPYAPISQCQRCLDRSYSVPSDFSTHGYPSTKHQTVLGVEIPLYSTLPPTELLDRHLESGSVLHKNPSSPLVTSPTTQWTHFGGSAPDDEVSILRAQIEMLHAQLMFERHRRQQHAVRNRRFLGKITRSAALEEENNARKHQLGLQESEIKFLTTALDSLRYEYQHYKEKQREMAQSKEEEISALRREKDDLHYSNTNLRSTLDQHKQDHQRLLNEFKTVKSECFTLRQELAVAKRRLTKHDLLINQVTNLNKELLLMGELQNKYQEELKCMESQRVNLTDYVQLTAPYKAQITTLTANQQSLTAELTAAITRVSELEEQLTHKEHNLTDQHRAMELCKMSNAAQVDALNARIRSLQRIIHRLEAEILDLFSRLHDSRHDHKNQAAILTKKQKMTTQSSGEINKNETETNEHDRSRTLSSSSSNFSASYTNQFSIEEANDMELMSVDSPTNANGTIQKTHEAPLQEDSETNVPRTRSNPRPVSVSADIPRRGMSKPSPDRKTNFSYPTRIPVKFDYTAWHGNDEETKDISSSATDRPTALDYDHDLGPAGSSERNIDSQNSQAQEASSASGLVDSGLHESKSE